MRHSEFREWAEMELGDRRQVYAREADAAPEDPLFFLPDGAALQFREDAKSGALICPVPGCSSPKLTTRGSETRRDHFVHIHAPTNRDHDSTYRRLATRRLLGDWVAGQDRVVDLDETKLDGVSIAWRVWLDNGESRVALCYVDRKLGADAWEERNDFLRSNGWATAWIFAPRKLYFAPPESAEPVVEDPDRTDLILDRPIYKKMRKNGSWPLLLNVDREKLANVITPRRVIAESVGFDPPVSNRVQHIAFYELAVCRLCQYGIATPAVKEGTLRKSSANWLR